MSLCQAALYRPLSAGDALARYVLSRDENGGGKNQAPGDELKHRVANGYEEEEISFARLGGSFVVADPRGVLICFFEMR
jgi:hypothetical protein